MLGKSLPVVFVAILFVQPAARAADKESREREAKRACLNGEVEVGVKLLTDLYVDTNDPTYIYNQGRCYEQGSQYEPAIGRFREYLRKVRNASDEDRADVERHIADCESLLQKGNDRADEDRDQTRLVTPAAPTQPLLPNATGQPDAAVLTQPASAQGARGRGLRIGGIVVGLTGAAALTAGLALNLKYNSTTSDLEGNYDHSRASSNLTYKRLSQIGYAAGAASLVAGAVMYYLGWQAGRVTVVPASVGSSNGIVLTGAF